MRSCSGRQTADSLVSPVHEPGAPDRTVAVDEAFLDPDPMTQLSRWLAVARDTIGSAATTSLTRYTDAQSHPTGSSMRDDTQVLHRVLLPQFHGPSDQEEV